MLFLQPSIRRKYCSLKPSSSPLVRVTSPAGRHGAPSLLFMAFWWITDPLKMSTTEVAHRSAVMLVVWVKNVAKSFISSLIVFTFIKTQPRAYSHKTYKRKVQGLLLAFICMALALFGKTEKYCQNRNYLINKIKYI